MTSQEFKAKAISLIDDLKAICASYGLGNDGNKFKIITQVFLYKFLNDKFAYEVKHIKPSVPCQRMRTSYFPCSSVQAPPG